MIHPYLPCLKKICQDEGNPHIPQSTLVALPPVWDLEYFLWPSFHVVGLISPDVTTAHILLHHVNLPAQRTGLYYSQDQASSDPPSFPHPRQKALFLPHIPETQFRKLPSEEKSLQAINMLSSTNTALWWTK